jgi:hypothetical protein
LSSIARRAALVFERSGQVAVLVAQDVGIGPGDPALSRFPHRRAHLDELGKELDTHPALGIGRDFSNQPVARRGAAGHYGDLAGMQPRGWALECEHEAQRAFAHAGDKDFHAVLFAEPVLEHLHLDIGRIDAQVLAQGDNDHHFRPVVGGGKLLFDLAEPHHRDREDGECERGGEPPESHGVAATGGGTSA